MTLPSESERIAALEAAVALMIDRFLMQHDDEKDELRRLLGVPLRRRGEKIAAMSMGEVEDRLGLRDGLGRVVGRDVEGTT